MICPHCQAPINVGNGLTPARKQTLDAIVKYTQEKGFSPTLQEVANMTGVTKATVYEIVTQLAKKGYLEKQSYRARGIKVLKLI